MTGILSPAEAVLFWEQGQADQRHALEVAHRVLATRPGDREAARAALLHDIGKRGLNLGAIGRSLATVLDGLGVRLRGRYLAYREHGRRGAESLAAVGAGELAVTFAREHPGRAPAGTDPEQWAALLDADHG